MCVCVVDGVLEGVMRTYNVHTLREEKHTQMACVLGRKGGKAVVVLWSVLCVMYLQCLAGVVHVQERQAAVIAVLLFVVV